ncbi:MAG: hypothetical protein JWQ97_2042 [Phenylobacterium sp.]|nr:hypothetical protein [Phenylobacterium sp.]
MSAAQAQPAAKTPRLADMLFSRVIVAGRR